jgi:hypothetical protein
MNNQRMMNRPMQGAAEQMATHGRYGDSMLVHMNPVEVQGLASLSPTGSLTRNPMTGQPEAFLPFLAPLLGGMLGSAGFTALGGALGTGVLGSAATALGANAALAGAVGSGLATTAVTGDLKQGIMSGLTGYGVGSAVNAASAALDPAVVEAASTLADSSGELASITNLANTGATTADNIARSQVLNAPAFTESAVSGASDLPFGDISFNPESIRFQQGNVDALTSQAGKNVAENFSGDPMKFAGEFGKQLMTPQSILPVAVGEGMRGEDMAKDDFRDAVRKMEADKQATLDRSTAVRDASIDLARQDYGYSGYAGGGLVSIDPNEYARQMNGVQAVGMSPGGEAVDYFNNFRGKSTAAAGETQQTLRPPNVVTADQLQRESDALVAQGRDPRAGFAPEINYFRATKEEAGIPVPAPADPQPTTDPVDTGNIPINIGGKGGNNPYGNYANIDPSSLEPYVMPNQASNLANTTAPTTPTFTPADMNSIVNPQASMGIASLANKAQSSQDSAESAIDLIGSEEPLVPIYGRRGRGNIGRGRAAGGVVGLAEGGIAGIDPNAQQMQGNLSMDGGGMQMMTEQEVMGVASQVANAFAQGVTVDRLPPELVEKLRKATSIYGQEAVMQMIMQLSSQGQPTQVDNRPVLPPQEMPASNLGAEMGFPQPEPKTYNFQEGGVTPNPEIQLVEQTISAVLGRLSQEEADIIINMFISEFGQEAFEMLREQALQSVVPNAQTEGVIRGQGGGMDDMVNGMIGTEQPVAVSPGEYIVPADVVSGLGDGSTDGGVQELDGMLDRVRQTRTGTTVQPAPMRTGGALPA